MKEKLKRLKQRWQRFLTRPREIVLDLVLGGGLLFLCWMFLGYPQLWKAEFRRTEEQNLLSPSQIVYHQSRSHALTGEARLTRDITVGVGKDWAIMVHRGKTGKHIEPLSPNYKKGYSVPEAGVQFYCLEPGVQLLPVTWPTRGEEKGTYGWTFLALQLPEGAAAGRLTFTTPDGREQTLTGIPGENGTMTFWLDDSSVDWPTFSEKADGTVYEDLRHDVWGRAIEEKLWLEGLSWTLELTDGAGKTLPAVSGLFQKSA